MYITGYSCIHKDTNDSVDDIAFLRMNLNAIARDIEREDRSMLSDMSGLSLSTVSKAVEMASAYTNLSRDEALRTAVFTASEAYPQNFDVVTRYIDDMKKQHSLDKKFEKICMIGKLLNPLIMFKKLSTNSIYHISKKFGFKGGGYPLVRASLSGLVALEEIYWQMNDKKIKHAVLSNDGNMLLAQNKAAFKKLSCISGKKNNITPNISSVALFLESDYEKCKNREKAHIICVKSIYKTDNRIKFEDWVTLIAPIKHTCCIEAPYIVLYGNGDSMFVEAEKEAMLSLFPDAKLIFYKHKVGYPGKSNNLSDLAYALQDSNIPAGSFVMVNGVGICNGYGTILLKKIGDSYGA